METNIAPGLRFSILDREFKKKLEERANRMGLTAVQLRVLGELSRAESMGACEINQKDLEKALAVTHLTMPVNKLLITMAAPMVLSMLIGALLSRFLGERKQREVNQTALHGIILGIGF